MNSNRTLLVISHTKHYVDSDGIVSGWSSTVKELDELATIFTKIIHVASLHSGKPPNGLSTYKSNRVEFVSIPPYGGQSILKKLSIIYYAPIIIWKVFRQLRHASYFQFRAPTAMGVYLIPLLTFFSTKAGWIKYAGNWVAESPPLSYAFQRLFLIQFQKRLVTINGKWPNQPKHCISFENPCLMESEVGEAEHFVGAKEFKPPFRICFIGRLESAKGVGSVIEAFRNFEGTNCIESIQFVGDGPERVHFENLAKEISVKCHFHGFLSRDRTIQVLQESHFLLFPSLSEGFPKVIAEAWNFGCLPIAADISSIPQYVIDHENGFILERLKMSPEYIQKRLHEIFEFQDLQRLAIRGQEEAKKFTYERYAHRLKEILELH